MSTVADSYGSTHHKMYPWAGHVSTQLMLYVQSAREKSACMLQAEVLCHYLSHRPHMS